MVPVVHKVSKMTILNIQIMMDLIEMRTTTRWDDQIFLVTGIYQVCQDAPQSLVKCRGKETNHALPLVVSQELVQAL